MVWHDFVMGAGPFTKSTEDLEILAGLVPHPTLGRDVTVEYRSEVEHRCGHARTVTASTGPVNGADQQGHGCDTRRGGPTTSIPYRSATGPIRDAAWLRDAGDDDDLGVDAAEPDDDVRVPPVR